jgi:hypothetical protein
LLQLYCSSIAQLIGSQRFAEILKKETWLVGINWSIWLKQGHPAPI